LRESEPFPHLVLTVPLRGQLPLGAVRCPARPFQGRWAS
jgi:hypothetical protein